ncbi:MAG: SDR family oxidoreductase [Rhodospirillum sp.]|nr:SDR family oxidoreductase [Rhodospirillum sp.]
MTDTKRVAVVTGASRGLGRAIALEFAKEGFTLALVARDAEALAQVAANCEKNGAPAVLPLSENLKDPEAATRIVDVVLKGLGRIDCLVNNAGDTKRGDFLDLSDEDHLSGFALKYHAAVRLCRAAWASMEATKGSIVNISGVGAHTPEPDFTVGGPVNSALINFSKALSKRAGASGVRVNVVCPGHIVTDRLSRRIETHAEAKGMTFDEAQEDMRVKAGIQRYGTPEDVAAMVVFLCSDKAAYVQGTGTNVDGGATRGI